MLRMKNMRTMLMMNLDWVSMCFVFLWPAERAWIEVYCHTLETDTQP